MNETRKLVVSIDDQTLRVLEAGVCIREFLISTAIKGMGFAKDSYRTPVGNFRICEKIGADQPVGTIFKARVPVGQWHPGESPDEDLVLTRILRLDGIDPVNVNTLERCVYIHGTNREDMIGQPAGHGCVRLRNDDMVALFDMVMENNLLEIKPATRRRGKLLFIVLESLPLPLDSNGEIAHFISTMKAGGWLPVLIADCPAPLIPPIARQLGISHVEAPLPESNDDGSCADSRCAYPIIGGFHRSAVVQDWLAAFLPERVVMIGDPSVDNEINSMVDHIIAPDLICNPESNLDQWF